jgi:pimeloyl-ACP methyl ester carboxylesterase
MKKFIKWTGFTAIGLIFVYFVGPRSDKAMFDSTLPSVSADVVQLEKEIQTSESKFSLKPDNEARIIWADTAKKQKTKYSMVYIHGFGATWAEGDPIHKQLAKKYGCNLYLARLHDAGVKDPNAFEDLTPENFLAGAKHALAVGKALGDSVIVIGCSAGGLLSAYLAAEHPDIKALILYSPCFQSQWTVIGYGALGRATIGSNWWYASRYYALCARPRQLLADALPHQRCFDAPKNHGCHCAT